LSSVQDGLMSTYKDVSVVYFRVTKN